MIDLKFFEVKSGRKRPENNLLLPDACRRRILSFLSFTPPTRPEIALTGVFGLDE
ncbi:MAG TPA: hypothetical protein VE130_16285 [Nitrososphaeraceae archaeon]|nr:hypothetical protein [Nitrososphaeraceae archaeon]